jgi:DNA-directed RNA polymerase specialized sigma24 family protein
MPKKKGVRKLGVIPDAVEPLEPTGPDSLIEFRKLLHQIDLRVLRRWVYKHHVRNFGIAEELVSEACARALKAAPSFETGPTLPQVLTYLQTTLKRLAWEWQRREEASVVDYCADPTLGEAAEEGVHMTERIALQKDAELILRASRKLTSRGPRHNLNEANSGSRPYV